MNKIFQMKFANIYPLYLAKVTRKGRTKDELDAVIRWLTGYDDDTIARQIDGGVTLEQFFADAPQINPRAKDIRGSVCGHRVQDIADPLMQQIRWMDKLVDDVAKGIDKRPGV